MSAPTPRTPTGRPRTLAPGESIHLSSGNHPSPDASDEFSYTVIALSGTRFDLTAQVEYSDGYTEIVRSGPRARNEYNSRSVDGAVRHVAYYDWVSPANPYEHEEIIRLNFHSGVRRVALVLHIPDCSDKPRERQFAVHIMSGNQVTIEASTCRHYVVETVETVDHPGSNRHLMAVIHQDRALRLEAPGLRCTDPNLPLDFIDGVATFGYIPDGGAAEEAEESTS